jgi:D-alanyl-lipoteichoic acid acyltransferase DltB (MBOAT superfamily)
VSFTSPLFYVALVPAVAAFYLLPGRWRAIYLLALSYVFYALSSRIYLVLLIIASAAVYGLGLAIARSASERAKQAYMGVGVAAVVAVIVAFKAAGAWRGLLLPLGVSYYSFKLISYLIEVYWDDEAVERDPVVFFLFPAFFPQIVSGPIQRPEPFFAQMREIMARPINADQVEAGFRLILGGLMMKTLIGDRLAAFIDIVDKSHADFSYWVMLTTVACYTLQLYADFAGYTNIALGVGKLFGVEGPPNFNAPFAAVNIQEMWRRWHMSLTLWLTDYLFTPLSMSLRDYGQAGLVGAICLNMIIIGLWHGFTLNYLVFGILHAIFLSVTVLILGERVRRKRAAGKSPAKQNPNWVVPTALLSFLGAALTFALMSFSQIFFHSSTFDEAASILAQVVGVDRSGPIGWFDMPAYLSVPAWICMAVALYVGAGAPGFRGLAGSLTRAAPNWLQYGVCLFLLSVLSTEGGGRFIYGQF